MIIAKAILRDDSNHVLLLRRSATDTRRPGEPDFPGGQIELGEELTAGVIREIAEETGLTVTLADLTLLYAATTDYDDVNVTRLLFTAKVRNAEVRLSNEHDEYRWLELAAAQKAFPYTFYGEGLKYAAEHELI